MARKSEFGPGARVRAAGRAGRYGKYYGLLMASAVLISGIGRPMRGCIKRFKI